MSKFKFKQFNREQKERIFEERNFTISSKVTEILKVYTGLRDLEVFILMTAGLDILLYKYGFTNHTLESLPIRSLQDSIDINQSIPLSVEVKNTIDLKSFFGETNSRVVNCYKNAKTTYKAHKKGESSNILVGSKQLHLFSDDIRLKYDLVLLYSLNKEYQQLILSIEYNTQVFSNQYIDDFLNHYNKILEAYNKLSVKIGRIRILNFSDIDELILKGAIDQRHSQKAIIGLFKDQVIENPDRIAIVFGNSNLSYRFLELQSDVLVHKLVDCFGISPGDVIGVKEGKSEQLIVLLLAILKSGSIFTPINNDYPEEKVKNIVNDTNMKMVISDHKMFLNIGTQNIQLKDLLSQYQVKAGSKINASDPNRTSFIIHTSATTGPAKGVALKDKAIANLALDKVKRFRISKEDVVSQFFTPSFDAFLIDVFTTLLCGAKLVIIDSLVIKSKQDFLNHIDNEKITILSLTPSYLNVLEKANMKSVRLIQTFGEFVNKKDALFYAKSKEFYNAYGPTESGIEATVYKVTGNEDPKGVIPIGDTVSTNKKILLLDQDLNIVPKEVEGEICIGGDYISNGYLNRVEFTNDKFIQNPYNTSEILFKTGDIGKLKNNGTIELIGRKDRQVKLRGHRIILDELENVLLTHENIENSVVDFDDAKGVLTLYYQLNEQKEDSQNEIINYAKEKLIKYMIPQRFIEIKEIPFTINGKIDYKNLRSIEPINNAKKVVLEDETERKLVDLWGLTLGHYDFGLEDHFFEVGGDSLKFIKFYDLLKSDFPMVNDITYLFKAYNIKKLATLLKNH